MPETSLEPLNALFVAWAVSALEAIVPLLEEEVLLVEEESLVAEALCVLPAVFGAAALNVAACRAMSARARVDDGLWRALLGTTLLSPPLSSS